MTEFFTPAGSMTGGGPVNADVKFTTGSGTIMITLTNLQANPTDVAQLLSDLLFHVSTGQNSGTISTSSANEINVAGDGTHSAGGSNVAVGWVLQTVGANLELNDLGAGGAGPAHLIIGPPGPGSVYSNANGSIAGNNPHNPFLDQVATWTLSVPGVTSTSVVDSATFSFGTVPGINVPGQMVPEPAALASFAIGAALIGGHFLRRKIKPVPVEA
jgi:hypothetical protein